MPEETDKNILKNELSESQFEEAATNTLQIENWKSLTAAAREGIALAAAFGYPAQSPDALGVPSADDAYTATQFIIWEYQLGLRTTPDEQISDTRYKAKIAGTPAETAYKTILSNIGKYISNPQYDGNTQDLAGFVQLTSGSTSSEQEIICFYGTTPKLIEKGYIEVYKKDTDGNLLDGAEFSVYDKNGAYVAKIGPTVNGYAKSGDLDLGTYTVVETKFPVNYREYGQSKWTVTLSSGNVKVTVNAVNEIIPGSCQIIKVSEDGQVSGISFRITGNGVDKTAETDEEGKITFSELKPGRYTVTESTADKYIPQSSKSVTVVTGQTAVVTFSNILKRGSLKVTKTAEDGLKEGLTFRLSGTSYSGLPVEEYAVTDKDGTALFDEVLIGSGYILEEVNTPAKYVVPEKQTVTVEWNKVTNTSVENLLKKWRADVCKLDGELNAQGLAQGGARLKGTVYGVYKGSQLIDTYTTDENGCFITEYYVCADDWSIREICPPEGYLLDETVYKIDCSPGRYTVIKNTEYVNLSDRVIKGRINIIKHSDDGSTQIETPEESAVFEVFLRSSGSYKNAKEAERDIITTDKYGFCETKPLPYGCYTVKQISGADGKELMPQFDVYIKEDGEAYRYIINNAEFESLIEIQKKDTETGKIIPAAGVGFRVRNTDTGEYVVQHINYPTPMDIEVYYTDSTGRLMLPERLPFGCYEITEVNTCYGYVLDTKPVPFKVDGTTALVNVQKANIPQKGTVTVTKSGEVFASVRETDGVYSPVYETKGLSCAVFSVIAAEDIYTPDGSLRVKKGAEVDRITTNADGKAVTKPLYLGKYEIKEISAPYGYVAESEPVAVELSYAGENVSVTDITADIVNIRQKAEIKLKKALEIDGRFGIGLNQEILSVKFAIYAAKDITAADGSIIPKDGLIEIASCGSDGELRFIADLPVGAECYVKEYSTDGHYILSDTVYPVEFEYGGQNTATVHITINGGGEISNKIIRGTVKGKKTDEDGFAVAGAVFGLFSSDETDFTKEQALLLSESDESGLFSFEDVPCGKWIIKELSAPQRYVMSDKLYYVAITFEGETVMLEAVNKTVSGGVRVVKLNKANTSQKLSGAEFILFSDADNNGIYGPDVDTVQGRLCETEPGVYECGGLKYGGYFLYELKAPDKFQKDDRYFYFRISEDGETVLIENEKGVGFTNEPIPEPVTDEPTAPKTGDNSNIILWILMGGLSCAVLVISGCCFKRYRLK